MSKTIQDVITILEKWAPTYYAEDFDNVGLLVGNKKDAVTGILVTLDALEETIDEAIEKNCNLIVTFHPIIFSGLKKLTGSNYVERSVIKAIKKGIAIYSLHTALDNSSTGVNAAICRKLGLNDTQILIPKRNVLKKLITFTPTAEAEKVKQAMLDAGAGHIGNYDRCSFSSQGIGSYRANKNANPNYGVIGKEHLEKEVKIEVIVPIHIEEIILQAMKKSHPYEEIAYNLIPLSNSRNDIGMGMTGSFTYPLNQDDFLKLLKVKFGSGVIRFSETTKKPITKVAVLGGSGSFAIAAAKASGADAFVTSDLKYHDFFQAENQILLADIGHFESEQFTKNLIADYLTEKLPNFATIFAQTNTNPVQYK